MTRKLDKYGRKVEERTILAKDYEVGPEVKKHTLYKRNPLTGRFLGRYTNVPRALSDNTRYIRVTHPIDVNHDKIPDLHVGQVIGRLRSSSSGKPPYIKVKVHISNPQTLAAMKQTQKEKFRKIMAKLGKKQQGDGRLIWW